jgi:UDP-2,3-diacylglucosamine pyrophosphatase LpxH
MEEHLIKIFSNLEAIDISDNDNLVIFSDLHMGDGGINDDFLHNGSLTQYVIENHYEKKDYKLILNGDTDELQRFPLKSIYSRWYGIYTIFKRFHERQSLFKLVGNHDFDLCLLKQKPEDIPVIEALKLRYQDQYLFIFHGHQSSIWIHKWIRVIGNFILRIVANPLRIKNYSVALNKKKKYKIEKRVYDFARKMKIIAFIGHTHRPLFESLSKKENLRFKIERLCREYPGAEPTRKLVLEKDIIKLKKDLEDIIQKRDEEDIISNLYNTNSDPLVPCLFNSGSTIGKSGITCIEISQGNIRLVYWFDKNVSQKYFNFREYPVELLDNSPYYRVTLKEESLNYLFTRIRLLSD